MQLKLNHLAINIAIKSYTVHMKSVNCNITATVPTTQRRKGTGTRLMTCDVKSDRSKDQLLYLIHAAEQK